MQVSWNLWRQGNKIIFAPWINYYKQIEHSPDFSFAEIVNNYENYFGFYFLLEIIL